MENFNYKNIGALIKIYRKEKKFTQQQLADLIGKTESSIRKYEKGLIEIPNSVLMQLADALDVPIARLLGLSENIKRYREIYNISQEELANRTNLSIDAITKYENGAEEPDINTSIKLSNGLNTDVLTLTGLDELIPWKNANKHFYKNFINDKPMLKAIEIVKEDFNNFNYEEFKNLSEKEMEKVFNDLSTVNPINILRFFYNDILDETSRHILDDFNKYITAYYKELIEDIILNKYKPLIDIIDIQNEINSNIKSQVKKSEGLLSSVKNNNNEIN